MVDDRELARDMVALSTGRPDATADARERIRARGERVVPDLVQALEGADANPVELTQLLRLLSEHAVPATLDAVAARLGHPRAEVKESALTAVACFPQIEATAILERVLRAGAADLSVQAGFHLATRGGPADVTALGDALAAPNPAVRIAAARGLCNLDGLEAAALLAAWRNAERDPAVLNAVAMESS